MPDDPSIRSISEWRSIVTLIVFILSNIVVVFRFHVAIYIPRCISNALVDLSAVLRVISPGQPSPHGAGDTETFIRLGFPMNPTIGPLIGVLFLLATTAIGRNEVRQGTLGANSVNPMDIMAVVLTIGYMSSAMNASGLIRHVTFKIMQRYSRVGHHLFMLLYVAFFAVGSFFGNGPVIQMGMFLLTYMVRMSSNEMTFFAFMGGDYHN